MGGKQYLKGRYWEVVPLNDWMVSDTPLSKSCDADPRDIMSLLVTSERRGRLAFQDWNVKY